MTGMCSSILVVAGLCASGPDDALGQLGIEEKGKPAALRYEPSVGDLVFFDDHNPIWTALFVWAGTGPPLHMGIVVKKVDGSFAVLEAGPDDTVWVTLQDLSTRLRQFERSYHGTVTIRRCKKALPREACWAMTRFAYLQDGKPYAVARLLLQGTCLRSRGPVREWFLGSTQLDRFSWICSELAVAAGTVGGLFPKTVKANVTYPRDLFDNRRHDLSETWHDAAVWRSKKEGPP